MAGIKICFVLKIFFFFFPGGAPRAKFLTFFRRDLKLFCCLGVLFSNLLGKGQNIMGTPTRDPFFTNFLGVFRGPFEGPFTSLGGCNLHPFLYFLQQEKNFCPKNRPPKGRKLKKTALKKSSFSGGGPKKPFAFYILTQQRGHFPKIHKIFFFSLAKKLFPKKFFFFPKAPTKGFYFFKKGKTTFPKLTNLWGRGNPDQNK